MGSNVFFKKFLKPKQHGFTFTKRQEGDAPCTCKVIFENDDFKVDISEVSSSELLGMAGTFLAFATLTASTGIAQMTTHDDLVANNIAAKDSTPEKPLCDFNVMLAIAFDAAKQAYEMPSMHEMAQAAIAGMANSTDQTKQKEQCE